MKRKRMVGIILSLIVGICLLAQSMVAFAGVTDTGNGEIIRTTRTVYYTTVMIEGTFTASGMTTPENFTYSSEEITGNISDADVQAEINQLKEAFRSWANEKNATEISFDNEAVSALYYEVHDEIVNNKEGEAGIVTICTVLDKHQTYTIEASAIQSDKQYTVDFSSGSWKVGNSTVTTAMNGEYELADYTTIPIEGFDPETMEIVISTNDGFRTVLSVTESGDYDYTRLNQIADSNVILPQGNTLYFSVVPKIPEAEEPNILPAFSNEQIVTAGIGAFEDPHFVEFGENDEFINVTGTISYTLTDGTIFATSNELKEYLSSQEIGSVVTVDYQFLGNGEYTDFMDIGTLNFTIVSGVDNVSISIDAPKRDEALANNASVSGTAAGAAVEKECLVVKNVEWIDTSDSIAAANTEYTVSIVIKTDRGVYFAGDVNNITVKINGDEVPSKDKSIFADENTNELTVTYTFSKTEKDAEIIQPTYKFIEGINSSWIQSSEETLTFKADGDFSKFTGVKVDDMLIDEKNYSAISGSTIVTLNNNYLKSLAIGTHSLTVIYTDGDCSTNFEIKAKQNLVTTEQTLSLNTQVTAPQTGDNNNTLLWMLLLASSGIALTGVIIFGRRMNHR